MGSQPNLSPASTLDILERILDRGIVIDVVASVSVLGIHHIVDVDARVVVTSIDTYMRYAQPVFGAGAHTRPVRIKGGGPNDSEGVVAPLFAMKASQSPTRWFASRHTPERNQAKVDNRSLARS